MEDIKGKIIVDGDIVLCLVDNRQMLIHVKSVDDMPREVVESKKTKIIANAKDMPSLIR